MNILGVRIDSVSKSDALFKVTNFLASKEGHMIFTPNPEMLVEAQKDSYFREVLNKGDLNICDGKGLEFVARGKLERIPGVDFVISLCELAEQKEKSVYLLGSGFSDVMKKCKENLLRQFPLLKIVGTHPGPKIKSPFDFDKEENEKIIDDIILSAPDILLVGFGHGKQEKWMYGFLPELPSVRVAMGVGGTFDFIAGKFRRAPIWMQKFGLEWLFRLIQEPWRIKRIWKATVVFPFLYFKNK